jgi:hypothetical protein
MGEQIVNLYGRSIGSAFAHFFLPGGKGGLYAWKKVRRCSEVILVEGLFDYAVLRQAGTRDDHSSSLKIRICTSLAMVRSLRPRCCMR